MKKLIIGVLSLGLVVGGGAAVYAQSDANNSEGMFNFGQMSKIMSVVHPDQSEEELKDMYNTMHGTNGAAPSANFNEMAEHMGDMDVAGDFMSEMHGELSEEDIEKMAEFMDESNGKVNFGQMKKLMEEIHPDLTKEEIKDMYQLMHGTNGASPSANFNGMHN